MKVYFGVEEEGDKTTERTSLVGPKTGGGRRMRGERAAVAFFLQGRASSAFFTTIFHKNKREKLTAFDSCPHKTFGHDRVRI